MTLSIATPCHEDWNRMTPQGPGRHCASCDKTVVDLTTLPAEASRQALDAIAGRTAAGEKLCVRGHADARGRLRATRARRRLLTNGLAAMLAVAMTGAVTGCGDGAGGDDPAPQQAQPVQTTPLMGAPAPTRQMMGEACVVAPAPEPVVAPIPEPALMGDVCEPSQTLPPPTPLMGKVAAEPAPR